MRVGIISDLHANLVALDAVLAELESEGVDQIVCLGDVADLGPKPAETVDRVRALGCPTLRGNHDPFDDDANGPEELAALTRWCKEQLSEDQLEYLRTLPMQHDVDLGSGRTLRCVHGSPRSFDEGLTTSQSDAQLAEIVRGHEAEILCAGHTHVQMLRRLGTMTVVNVGSVGCPYETVFNGTPPNIQAWAEYAVVHASPSSVSVELRRTDYDVHRFAAETRAATLPNAEFWAAQWTRNA